MDSSGTPKRCLICSTPNDSVRYGIDACRACASFYKRSQKTGRRFPCKTGTRQCTVSRAEGSMCRSCRYDKCTALGMMYEGPIILPNLDDPTQDLSPPALSTSSSSPVRDSLLDRIAREDDLCYQRIRTLELSLAVQHNLQRVPHPKEEIYLVTLDFAIASFNANISNSWKFFQSVFPSMSDLHNDDQREFYRLCMPAFSLLYAFYRTKVHWGDYSKYMMFSAITCADLQHPEAWMGSNGAEGGTMQKGLLDSIGAYIRDQVDLVVPLFEKADICEREKFALLVFFLCESDMEDDFAERFQPFLEGIRREILEDLHRFYTEEMGLSEYSTRLGNLLSLCHTFQEGSALFQEFFRMQVTVFDLYPTETLLQNLIL